MSGTSTTSLEPKLVLKGHLDITSDPKVSSMSTSSSVSTEVTKGAGGSRPASDSRIVVQSQPNRTSLQGRTRSNPKLSPLVQRNAAEMAEIRKIAGADKAAGDGSCGAAAAFSFYRFLIPAVSLIRSEPRPPSKEERQILKILTSDLCSGDKEELPRALERLSNFVVNESADRERVLANRKYIMENDGVGVIVQAMKSSPSDMVILAKGALLLQNIMYGFAEACDKVQRLGAAQTVMKAMKAHMKDEEVQRTGCGFFLNFIYDSLERKKFFSLELNGVSTILTAMKAHPHNRLLQKRGAGVISSLCKEPTLVRLVYKAGGLSVVSKALERHSEDNETKVFAKEVINVINEYLQSHDD